MHYCKDCKHYARETHYSFEWSHPLKLTWGPDSGVSRVVDVCTLPIVVEDLIRGPRTINNHACSEMRATAWMCGREATKFEAKE